MRNTLGGVRGIGLFPFSVRGQLVAEGLGPDRIEIVVASLLRELERAHARDVVREGSTLILSTVTMRRLLLPTESVWDRKGSISIVPGMPLLVDYEVSTKDLALLTGIWAFGMPFVVLALRGTLQLALSQFLVGVVGCSVLCLFVVVTVRSLISRALAISPDCRLCPSCSALYDPADYREDAAEWQCEVCRQPLPRLPGAVRPT